MRERTSDCNTKIVITGMGVISPLGLSVEETWENLVAGKSGIGFIEPSDLGNTNVQIAGQVKNFDPKKYFDIKELRRTHRSAQFSYAATLEALNQAGLLQDGKLINVDEGEVGILVGSGEGGSTTSAQVGSDIDKKGDTKINPSSIFLTLVERVSTVPSLKVLARGAVASLVAACATGAVSTIVGANFLSLHQEDVMVVGGSEASIDPIGISSFDIIRALSREKDPTIASCPFDKNASGFVMGEGAGVMVLEREEDALKRGANILAELAGFSLKADAHHISEPSGQGARRVMLKAMAMAGVTPSEVDYINAHGTSTPTGDPAELDAILDVFGPNNPGLSVSSTKSAIGHLLGAAGGLEAVICVMSILKGKIPPTLNLHNPIREGLDLVPLHARERRVGVAMSNSFGFGGINTALIFRRYPAI